MQEILSKISIAARVKDLRQRAQLSQAEVAQQLNISRSNYSQIELGNQFPTFEVLYRLASFYGKTYEWLLHGSEASNKDEHSHLLCDEKPTHRLGGEPGEIRHIQLVSCVKRNDYIKMANGGQNAVVLELLPDVIYHQPGLSEHLK